MAGTSNLCRHKHVFMSLVESMKNAKDNEGKQEERLRYPESAGQVLSAERRTGTWLPGGLTCMSGSH